MRCLFSNGPFAGDITVTSNYTPWLVAPVYNDRHWEYDGKIYAGYDTITYYLVLPIYQDGEIIAGVYRTKDKEIMDITQLVKVAGEDAEAAGWRSDRPQMLNYDSEGAYEAALNGWYGNKLMLMVSELSEGHDEIREGHGVREVYYNPNKDKPEGLPTELADAVIRIADFCHSEGIDLEAAIQLKLAYNRTRGFKHGGKQF